MTKLFPFRKTAEENGNNSSSSARPSLMALYLCGFFLSVALSAVTFGVDKRMLRATTNLMKFPAIEEYKRKTGKLSNQKFPWAGIHKVGLIHIGKCGGISVRKTIEEQKANIDNAILKRGIHSYHMIPPHIDHIAVLNDWILLVRDPIERLQSNWVYAHPANNPLRRDQLPLGPLQRQLYNTCYNSTFDNAMTNGLATPSTTKDSCPELLRQVLVGVKEDSQLIHFKRNFRYHLDPLLVNDKIFHEKNIHAVRTDHMLDDLNSINQAFGGKSSTFQKIVTHSHFWDYETNQTPHYLPYDNRSLSEEGMANLCWILCDEIQIYKQVLKIAKNLNKNQVEDSMHRLSLHCPEQAKSNLVCRSRTSDDWIKEGIRLSNHHFIGAGDIVSRPTDSVTALGR